MKFRKAIVAMFVSGKVIRRKAWIPDLYLDYTENDATHRLDLIDPCGNRVSEKLSIEDVLSDDWEVV